MQRVPHPLALTGPQGSSRPAERLGQKLGTTPSMRQTGKLRAAALVSTHALGLRGRRRAPGSESQAKPGAAGGEGGRRPGVGRREGPTETHHSVGSAGWLALAGRSGGESPGRCKKREERKLRLESRPPPRHRPRPRPVPPQTARKQTYFLPPAGPPAPPAAPGPRHSRRGLLSRDPGAAARCRPSPGCRRSGPRGRPAGEGGDASGFPPAARRRRHFSSQRRRWPCWP